MQIGFIDSKQFFCCFLQIGVVGAEVVGDPGKVISCVLFFIDKIGMGNNSQERKAPIINIQPILTFQNFIPGDQK